MSESITRVDDEVSSDSGRKSRFGREKKAETKAKNTEQKKKEQGKDSQEKNLSFRDAKEITRIGFSILHGNDLIVSKDELRYFAELLKKHGHDHAEVDRMLARDDAKIIQLAFNILREARVEEAEEKDWLYSKGSENRQREEEFISEEMQNIKNLGPDALSLAKVAKHITVDRFKKFDIEKKGGPGAAEADGQPADLDGTGASREITDLIAEMMILAQQGRNVDSDARWLELSGQLNEHLSDFNDAYNNKKFLKVHSIQQSIKEAKELAKVSADREEAMEKVVSEETRREIERKRQDLDAEFKAVYDKMTEGQRKALFEDITVQMGIELAGIKAGWRSYDEAVGNIFGQDEVPDYLKGRYGDGIVVKGASKEKIFGKEGIREWRATNELFGAKESVTGELLRRAPAQWEEVPQGLSNIYRLVEATDFSLEDLQHEIQQAYQMLDSIQATTPERRAERDKLSKELDAFRAFHSFRVSMEKEDMDPTRMIDTFKHYFDDESWQNFGTRFEHDERIRDFLIARSGGEMKNEKGETVTDKADACEKINIFDEAFSLYSERLRQERISMNLVEEMTRHEIGHEYSDSELEEFANWTGLSLHNMSKDERAAFKERVADLRKYFVEAMEAKIADTNEHNPGAGFDKMGIDEVWGRKTVVKTPNGKEIKCIRLTQNIIQTWHQEETLHGAIGKTREIRKKEMVQEIKRQLEKIGLMVRETAGKTPTAVDLDALEKSGLLGSVGANAYYMAWMFEWTPLDGIRVYSRDSKSKLDDDFDDIVFHQDTNVFFGRQVDHAWEFYHDTNENRGRSKENEVNRIFKQYLPGKHHYLFPQNMAMVRWSYEYVMNDEQKAEVDRRTRELKAKYDFDNGVYHDEFDAWMRNVAVMDMIENGQFSFGQRKFSEMCKNVKKFEMIDLFSDRLKNKNYSDPDNFQSYLAEPTNERFMSLNSKKNLYSTRSARQFPWMTLAMRAHWEIINKHSKRLFDREDVQSEVMEKKVIVPLVTSGFLEKEQAVDFKRKNLGFVRISPRGNQDVLPTLNAERDMSALILGNTFVRRFRQRLEVARRAGWEERFTPLLLPILVFLALIWETARRMPEQATGQTRGR